MARRSRNMSPSRIKYMLSVKGWNFRDVDRAYKLAYNTTNKASRYPHAQAEKAIAEVLGKHPKLIWPARYNKDGSRLKPQPPHNYRDFSSPGKAQKSEAA